MSRLSRWVDRPLAAFRFPQNAKEFRALHLLLDGVGLGLGFCPVHVPNRIGHLVGRQNGTSAICPVFGDEIEDRLPFLACFCSRLFLPFGGLDATCTALECVHPGGVIPGEAESLVLRDVALAHVQAPHRGDGGLGILLDAQVGEGFTVQLAAEVPASLAFAERVFV